MGKHRIGISLPDGGAESMRPVPHKRLGLLSLILMLGWAAAAPRVCVTRAGALQSADGKEVITLKAGEPVERELSGGQTHLFKLTLKEGEFVRLTVEQRMVDVVVTVYGPDDVPRAEVDRPNGSIGPESVSIIADKGGEYGVRIQSLERRVAAGRYVISFTEPRPSQPRDLQYVAAEKTISEAERQRAKGTADSLTASVAQFDDAFHKWSELNEPYEAALALYGRGWSHNLLSEYDEAVTYFGQSLQLMRQLHDDYGEAIALTGLGYCYMYLGDLAKALESFRSALRLHQSLNNFRGKAATLSGVAAVNALQGDEQEALANYQEARQLRRQAGDRSNEALNLLGIGKTYNRLGQHREALDSLNAALQTLRSVHSRAGEADTLVQIGLAHSELDAGAKALDCFREALSISQFIGDRRGEAASLYGMARVEFKQGDLLAAREHMEQALNNIETLRLKITGEQFRLSFFATVQQYYDFYIDVLMRLQQVQPKGNYGAEALQVSERARARNLLDILSESHADIRSGVAPALLESERTLQMRLNVKLDYYLRLQSKSTPEEQLVAARQDLEKTQRSYDEVQRLIHVQSPGYAALKHPVPLNASEIRHQVLDADSVLLEYALGEEHCYLWVVTKDSLSCFTLPHAASQIKKSAHGLIEILTDGGGTVGRFERQAQSLTEMLLPEAAASEVGRKGKVLVVANGVLQHLPFNALSLRDSRSRYTPLVAEHEVINLPSASTLAILREQFGGRKVAPKPILVLADPVFTNEDLRVRKAPATSETRVTTRPPAQPVSQSSAESDIELARLLASDDARIRNGVALLRLPGTRREARTIQRLAPEAELALDFSANLSTATSPELASFRIIHFATHGIAPDSHPELSGIVLSLFDERGQPQEGYLGLPLVYNMRLPAELVVLSACETGLGEDVQGEGLVGLTRGFMYAGSPRVVASLWKVREQATEELMRRFYYAIFRKGLSPSAALSHAEASMWREQRWAPSDWAGFMFFGEWRKRAGPAGE